MNESVQAYEHHVGTAFNAALQYLQYQHPSAIPDDIISALVDGIRRISIQEVCRRIDTYAGASVDVGFSLHYWIYRVKTIWRVLKAERDVAYSQAVKRILDTGSAKTKDVIIRLAEGDPQYRAVCQTFDEVDDFLTFLGKIEQLIDERHYLLVQMAKLVTGSGGGRD